MRFTFKDSQRSRNSFVEPSLKTLEVAVDFCGQGWDSEQKPEQRAGEAESTTAHPGRLHAVTSYCGP